MGSGRSRAALDGALGAAAAEQAASNVTAEIARTRKRIGRFMGQGRDATRLVPSRSGDGSEEAIHRELLGDEQVGRRRAQRRDPPVRDAVLGDEVADPLADRLDTSLVTYDRPA